MAITSKYVLLTSPGSNFIDFALSYGALTLDGEEFKYLGSSAVDAVFVHPGMTFDFTSAGGGADKIYLGGNFADYGKSASGSTLTLTRTVSGKTETVLVAGGSGPSNDTLIFADGSVTSLATINFVKGTASAPVPGGETSLAPNLPATLNATVKAVALDAAGETFALARPGMSFKVLGGSGIDTVYVKSGTTVDASGLGGGSDLVYMTGNWADYTKSISGSTMVFTRTVGSDTERVTVAAGTGASNDKLVFADGAALSNNIKTAFAGNPSVALSSVSGYDAATTTPGLTPNVTAVNVSTAPNLSGQSVISGKAVANATVTVVIDPDNNTGTANSFSYTTTADANGDYSLNLATATPTSGSAGFAAGTASVSVTQTVSGSSSSPTVITLPVSATTSYSASIASDQVTEGGSAVFTVTRSGDTSGTGTVVYASQNGTATAGSDYTAAASTTLTFTAGQTTKTVTVATTDDALIEGNETLSLVLSSPVGGYLGTGSSASATIVDNEVGLFSLADVATGVSFSEGVGTKSFTVNRSGLTTGAATVVVSSGGGTATPGSAGSNDYNAVNQTLSFAAGETSKTVTVTVNNDVLVEGNETFNLQLSNASAGNLIDAANASVSATIQDNEVATISLDNAAAGVSFNEGAGNVTFSLTRGGNTASAVSVVVQSAGSTATPGSAGSNDYNAVNQTISFAAGETSKTVTVAINDDAIVEANETFSLQLSSPSAGAVISSGAATITATILDNEQSSWSVAGPGSVSEGAGSVAFTVSRSGASGAATIVFATGGGTATATLGANNDYTAVNQTLNFAAGEMSKTVNVVVNDDTTAEGNETIGAAISGASSGTIATGVASATLVDNEQSNWSVAGPGPGSVSEGAGSAAFTVSRTGDSAAATIVFATSGGTAAAGSDYTAMNQTLSFAAGEMSKTVSVAVADDLVAEANETLSVVISGASSGNIATGAASATILDNEQSNWSVAGPGNVSEGAGSAAFTVSRTGASAAATIVFVTSGGTATAGSDYTAVPAVDRTLSFAAGEMSKTVSVAVANDSLAEVSETIGAAISDARAIGGASSGNIATGTASATLVDDDQSLWSVAANGGNIDEDAGFMSFTVSRTGGTEAATLKFSAIGGTVLASTALAGIDFAEKEELLTFAIGEMSKTVNVELIDDTIGENLEALNVVISDASSGSIGTVTVSTNIADNDQSLWRVGPIDSTTANESAGVLSFEVTRNGALGAATIEVGTIGGTAIAGSDYTKYYETLSFAAGESRKIVSINLINDAVAEGVSESIYVGLGNASTGTVRNGSIGLTILDDDQSYWSVAAGSSVAEAADFLSFTVSRSGDLSLAASLTFDAVSAQSIAGAGADYTASHQTVNFAAGQASQVVLVPILDDSVAEVAQLITGVISNPSLGIIASASSSGTVPENDSTRTRFSIAASAASYLEDTTAVYTIIRSGDTSGAQTIEYYDAAAGTATAGADYGAFGPATLSFAAGEGSKQISVDLLGDALVESSETLIVGLRNASAGAITTATATSTLTDGDSPAAATSYGIAIIRNGVYESTGLLQFQIQRSADSSAAVTYFRTNGGTATAGSDYTLEPGQAIIWNAGESIKTVFVHLIDDAAAESTETVIGQIATDSGFTTDTHSATGSILDDDTAAANTYAILVGSTVFEGSETHFFTVTRSGDMSIASTSYFRTNGGTATAGTDYTAIAGQTLSWGVGEASKVVGVVLANDSAAEGSETIIAQIATDSGFTTGTATATDTVLDDDTYTAAAGVADTLTTGAASGAYLGGSLLSTGDMDDTVTIGTTANVSSVIDLGAGNDTLITPSIFLVTGMQLAGGTGVDTLSVNTSSAFNFSTAASVGNYVTGFEILSMAALSNQTMNLSLADVLEFTRGNAVADTLRITGTAGDSLNLQTLGKTLSTPAPGTNNLTDVDGSTYNVVASAAGNAFANDVTIGGQIYDVFQYQHSDQFGAHTIKLLVNTVLTSTVAPTFNVVAGNDVINSTETGSAITGTAEAGASVALTLGAGNVRTVTANGSGNWSYTLVAADITAMGQGAETLSAKATDTVGNVSEAGTHDITVDTSIPAAPTINTVAGNDVIDGTETGSAITGTAEAGASVALTLGTGNVRSVTADGSGNWSYTLVAADITAMGQGAETLSATATDTAGNVSAAGTRAITVDTITAAPTIAMVAGNDVINGTETGSAITGTAEAGASVALTLGTGNVRTVTADGSGNWSYTLVAADITAMGQGAETPERDGHRHGRQRQRGRHACHHGGHHGCHGGQRGADRRHRRAEQHAQRG
jgi:hypothetical protein